MRKFLVAALAVCFSLAGFAQTDTTVIPSPVTKQTSKPRSSDHFVVQFGYTSWQGAPDSIATGGFSRTSNVYLMLDFPFKTSPNWSVAIGVGMGTDNVYFDKGAVDITGTSENLRFRDLKDTSHFKKYKLATAYAEAPVELRYRTNPDDDRNSVKMAIGIKVGTLLNAHTKGKTLQDKVDNTINDYKVKEFSKRYFNSTRIAATARLGYGPFTLFGTYALTPLFKEGQAPLIRPLTIGLTLSGL
jgi:hypothetical protein